MAPAVALRRQRVKGGGRGAQLLRGGACKAQGVALVLGGARPWYARGRSSWFRRGGAGGEMWSQGREGWQPGRGRGLESGSWLARRKAQGAQVLGGCLGTRGSLGTGGFGG